MAAPRSLQLGAVNCLYRLAFTPILIHVLHSCFTFMSDIHSFVWIAALELLDRSMSFFGLNKPSIESSHSFGLDANQSTHLKLLLFPCFKDIYSRISRNG